MSGDLRMLGRQAYGHFWQERQWDMERQAALHMARVERSRAPRCPEVLAGALRKPNAYQCQCTNVRLIHWQRTPCPTCGMTREESNDKRLVDAAIEDAKHRAKAARTVKQIPLT